MTSLPNAGESSTPAPRAVTALGDLIVIYGGMEHDSGTVLDDLHIYNTTAKNWTQMTPTGDRPTGRYQHSLVTMKDKVLLFGGRAVHNQGITENLYMLEYGVLTDTTWCQPQVIDLKGNDPSYINIPTSDSLSLVDTSFSFAVWSKQHCSDQSGWNCHPDYLVSTDDDSFYAGYNSGYGMEFGMNGNHQVNTGLSLAEDDGVWIHWAFIFDKESMTRTIYRNGAPVKSGSIDSVITSSAAALRIGKVPPSREYGPHNFRGKMADIILLTRAMPASEVSSLFQQRALSDTTGLLLRFYPIDASLPGFGTEESSSTQVMDFSGNGNEGMLNGNWERAMESMGQTCDPRVGTQATWKWTRLTSAAGVKNWPSGDWWKAAMAVVDNIAYVLQNDKFWSFEMRANGEMVWTELSVASGVGGNAPTPRICPGMVKLGAKLVMFGGGCCGGADLHVYDSLANQWSQPTTSGDFESGVIPFTKSTGNGALICTCQAGLNGALYVFDVAGYFSHLDISSWVWTTLNADAGVTGDIPIARKGAGMLGIDDLNVVVMFGGNLGRGIVGSSFVKCGPDDFYSQELLVYNASNKAWKLYDAAAGVTGTPPSHRTVHSMTAVGHRIFIFDGLCHNGLNDNDLFMFDFDQMHWSVVHDGTGYETGLAPKARHKFGMAAVGERLYMTGGKVILSIFMIFLVMDAFASTRYRAY